MKKLILILSIMLTTPAFADSTPIMLDKVIAVVNNQPITQSEFNSAIAIATTQLAQQNLPLPEKKLMEKQVLDSLIYKQLQIQLAKEKKIEISDQEVNKALTRIAEQNKATLTEMQKSIVGDGMNFDEYKERIR